MASTKAVVVPRTQTDSGIPYIATPNVYSLPKTPEVRDRGSGPKQLPWLPPKRLTPIRTSANQNSGHLGFHMTCFSRPRMGQAQQIISHGRQAGRAARVRLEPAVDDPSLPATNSATRKSAHTGSEPWFTNPDITRRQVVPPPRHVALCKLEGDFPGNVLHRQS
ncbi:hypothetical protein Bbelb_207790 [Branchiostoma belcheri]|nr:hypothetical protein Bbelb_207790 [Branchiostoma belcheri]